jgi:hypothetical protein
MATMIFPSRKQLARAYPSIIILLVLVAHLSVMALPTHARVMMGDTVWGHSVEWGADIQRHHSEWPSDAPVKAHSDACGLEAAPPATGPSKILSAIVSCGFQEEVEYDRPSTIFNFSRTPDPPPGDRLALLQVFRL